ncbi:MAG: hypothetical protein JXB35_04145 [Anaerolineae bacterium]|nr:hypothetical protein [Anaerolineae bacterium]
MKIVSRDKYIDRRVKAGQWLSLGALVVLGGSLIVFFTREEMWSLTMLIGSVGFIMSVAGSYYTDRFSGPMAQHLKVPELLKGLDDTHTLLMYSGPVPFMLVDPGGVTVLVVKNQGGTVAFQNNRWQHQQRLRFFRQMAGQESLGRPELQGEALVDQVVKYLKRVLPEALEIPVRAIAVFIDPDVQLEADSAPIPSLRASKVKGWLRGPGRRPALPAETRAEVLKAFDIEA